MSSPFNIELGPHFPAADKGIANFEINAFNTIMKAEMNLFNKAWAGWPSDNTAPDAHRGEAQSQDMLDAALKGVFGDIYRRG
ncbi:MAG: hypothetical protein JSS86_01270 [Cyanobacteria bacterium SZAS LIN-2]|nr:hypothetical protein [Cyanobacteria bacterium SZAS LIN-3]MBS1994902.1 hypothetical protein [Cyanobacteria bacterium SZAS LIN-2]